MTKPGFKQILVGIDTWGMLKSESIRQKKSINRLIADTFSGAWKACGALPHGSSNPPLGVTIFTGDSVKIRPKVSLAGIDTSAFEKFLIVQKNLSDETVKHHIQNLGIFLKSVGKKNKHIESADIQDFLLEIKKTKNSWTYKNYLSMLRILFRDYLKHPELIEGFKFPRHLIKPNILPSKQQLKIFFDSLPSLKYQVIFLMLTSSGLRVSELLSADVDKRNRMLIPKSHNGQTKQAWISFYNIETEALLREYKGELFGTSRNTVAHVFKDTSNKTSIDISAQTLRSIFAREMSRAGVADRYIDAFCGRTPQSVLARHYSDFSPEVLKEIYEKANLRYFS